MAKTNKPRIIVRYDYAPALEQFETVFGPDFNIEAFDTDQGAISALDRKFPPPAALLVLPEQPTLQCHSQPLMKARDCHPKVMKVLMGDTIPLDLLVSLLEQRLIDRCFNQLANPDLIRSQILAAALKVQAPTSESLRPANAHDTPTPTVLIVDDETAATKYLAKQLTQLQDDFRIICADSADQALELIRTQSDDFAVVMTDQRMPGMQGKELLDTLKQSYPTIVRILTSAYGEVDVALGAVNDGGIFRYQKKPWRAMDLLPLFQEAIVLHQSLASSRLNTRSQTEREFAQLCRQRQIKLDQILSEPVQACAGAPIMTEFLAALTSIESLPANTSHIRASCETGLENELLQHFGTLIRQQLACLQTESAIPVGYPDKDTILAALCAASEQTGMVSNKTSSITLMCRALTTLLNASGQSWRDLAISEAEHDGRVTVATPTALRFYTHLLAPLTRISRPLLEQQSALLILFISVHRLGGNLQVIGGHQSCRLVLSFAPGLMLDASC